MSQGHAGSPQLKDTAVVSYVGKVVTGVGEHNLPGIGIDDCVETGHEHGGRDLRHQAVVDVGQDRRWRGVTLGCGSQHRSTCGHDQGGRHAFVGDVADDHTEAPVFEGNEIVETATNRRAGR